MNSSKFCRSTSALWMGVAAAISVTVIGCGGGDSLQPVKGKVVYTDGTPVPAGTVTFNNPAKQVSATGLIAQDGTFSLKSGDSNGAPTGDYQVVVTGDTETYGAKPTVANIYGDPSQTPLKQTIVEGTNEVEIKVERAK